MNIASIINSMKAHDPAPYPPYREGGNPATQSVSDIMAAKKRSMAIGAAARRNGEHIDVDGYVIATPAGWCPQGNGTRYIASKWGDTVWMEQGGTLTEFVF